MVEGIATIRYLTTALFGHGAARLLGGVLDEIGVARPFVVTDPGVRAVGIADEVIERLPTAGHVCWFDRTPANPTEAAVAEAAELFRDARCDGIVAIGGGSSIDLAKGAALLATHPGPLSYTPTLPSAFCAWRSDRVISARCTAGISWSAKRATATYIGRRNIGPA